ncbi:MAG: D-cysteine desulfhydrase [Anaerolineales bacterium]|nr:D-cysteine desulfhydrase [Anaerolineales bacterium]MCB8962821.1 D-cysteine desulfhydrase [Ardenticatenales bacterium]
MQLSRFPRRRYTAGQTPIEHLPHLSQHLGGPQIYIKRDDLLGLSAGGNKTRKLEFLVADALAQGADTLITVGAVQSNHCRLTLAAAVKEGLKCQLVLEERVPDSYHEEASGNNMLYRLLGVEKIQVVKAGTDLQAAMESLANALAAQGRKAYIIPGGGSNALGCLGYVSCAEEIMTQINEMQLKLDHIVCSSGSGGTHSGLATGLVGVNANIPLTGISVRGEKIALEEKYHKLANEAAALLGIRGGVPRETFNIYDDYVGPGYSLPTESMIEAVQLFARLEGILLDPVYTGKAAAGLIDLVRKGHFRPDETVLFVHTGGSPALYAYQDVILASQEMTASA